MQVKSESEAAQSCLTLSDPMDCSLPGSSIHAICQARVLEWGAIAFSDRVAGELELFHRVDPTLKSMSMLRLSSGHPLPPFLWPRPHDVAKRTWCGVLEHNLHDGVPG